MNYFITGTDTGVGKTFFTVQLTRALRRAGYDTLGLKPICCGDRDDVTALVNAADGEVDSDTINPVWLREPAAPLIAARREGRAVDLDELAEWFQRLRERRSSLLVEGAGGWLVPLTAQATVADLAARLQLPVVVVVANKLGCLNHTLLTIESIRSHGLTCAGLVLNHLSGEPSVATETNSEVLREFCDVPILFELRPGQTGLQLRAE